MRTPRGAATALVLSFAAAGTVLAGAISVDGYLEFKKPGFIVVDGQRLQVTEKTKISAGKIKKAADIPLGYRVKAKGSRSKEGTIVLSTIEATKNGSEFLESDVIAGTNQAEKQYVSAKKVSDAGPDGKEQVVGKLIDSGPDVDRCRKIVDRLLPAYVDPAKVRVYVVDNPEWNAMAMANFSIYTFSGLMKDMDDDELAIVLGHELAHATYEHSRRQAKAGMASGIAGQAAQMGSGLIKNDLGKMAAQQATALGQTTFGNAFSRDYEDQADRVGLRYVYEAGYDYRKAPALWNKFAAKYGDQSKVENFFFGNHSLSAERAKALQKEIDRNYANTKLDPPTKPGTTAAAR
ncbi:MAG TPA: M48 family metalloprotease [Candidatus Polarisedimenticolia bacterium]|nr:M48 family metalloprotease [Candidatus Polarisedimenticolia bacterium]